MPNDRDQSSRQPALLRWSLLLFLAAFPATAEAQDQGMLVCPDSALTQLDMTVCASQAYRQRYTMMEGLLREIREVLAPESGDDFDRRPLLDSAQVAWEGYAKQECGFEASYYEGGSILPMVYRLCLAEKAGKRIVELAPQLCQGDPGEDCPPG